MDESDIVKKCATRMEGLNRVRDGSTGAHDSLGYDLQNIVAFCKQNNGYKMLPVSSDLFIDSIDKDTLSNLLHDRIDEITISSGDQGVFIFDRGFDSRDFINHLVSNENSFIIRGVGKRNLIIDHLELPFAQVCNSVPMLYRHP